MVFISARRRRTEDDRGDLIVYEYHDVFDYDDFVDKVTPLIAQNIEFPEDEGRGEGELAVYAEQVVDYGPEIEEMFERMGIRKLDGQQSFVFNKDCTYIEAIATGFDGDSHYVYAASVKATIQIVPHAKGKIV